MWKNWENEKEDRRTTVAALNPNGESPIEEVEQAELEVSRLERLTGKSTSNKRDHPTRRHHIQSDRDRERHDHVVPGKKLERMSKRATEVFAKLNNAPEVYTGIKVDKDFKTTILNSKGESSQKTLERSGEYHDHECHRCFCTPRLGIGSARCFWIHLGDHSTNITNQNFWNISGRPTGRQFLIFAHSGGIRS